MSGSVGLLARVAVRCAPELARLKKIPVVGMILSWAARKAMPRNSRVWVRVKAGVGAGLWLRVNPRTGRHILEGASEPAVQRALAEHLRPGMVFYDLGANIGFFSLLAARLVGQAGRVVSFEADPELVQRLLENLARNNFAWVSVEPKAVWSDSGVRLFARADPEESPDRGLGFVTEAPSSNTVQVPAVALDDYVRTAPAPDFIKCDVEGAELQVIRGSRALLRGKRPGILCEVHGGQNRDALLNEFAGADYACAPCDENHILALPRGAQ